MDRGALEKLLLDRHLGELSPEATTLLDDYLAATPAEQELARSIDQTLQLARRALLADTPVPAKMPARSDLAMPRLNRVTTPQRWTSRLAIAAAIAFAFLLGSSRDWRVLIDDSVGSSRFSASAGAASIATSFWSINRIRPTDAGTESAVKKIFWTSTAAWPNLGGRS